MKIDAQCVQRRMWREISHATEVVASRYHRDLQRAHRRRLMFRCMRWTAIAAIAVLVAGGFAT
jgi:hypothetical protein